MTLKTKTLVLIPCLLVLMVGTAWGVSPYDMPYGVQWNFQIGGGGGDGGDSFETGIDVTSDGTVFVINRTSGNSTWGSGSTGSINSGLGAITDQGQLLYGTTLRSLPGLLSPGQAYPGGSVNAAGNRVYCGFYGQNQYWTGEDGSDATRIHVWSLDSSGLASIADRHSLSVYANNTGTPRTDPLMPTTTGLTPVAGQNRLIGSAIRDSTLDMVMVMDLCAGDFATLGDYEGYNLRSSGTAPAYLPGIGVYNFNTNTLSGPAKQPILTYSGDPNVTWSNMGAYYAAAIDQGSGRYYGGGPSHTRTESKSTEWDPDGSGPAASIPFVNSTSNANTAAIGTAYDASNNLLYSVTWDTTGYDIIYSIAASDDGTGAAFWAGEKQDDCYIEKRDASGTVVWSDSFDMSPADANGVPGVERVRKVTANATGDLLVSGYFENGGAGGGSAAYDVFVRKYKKTGANSYAMQWSTVHGLAGTPDYLGVSALDANDQTLYVLFRTDGQWPNVNGFTYVSGNDLLVQKLTPGDFNSDGAVDFTDVQLAGDNLPAVPNTDDTYDFDGDGDSDYLDIRYMITNVMDRKLGDIHPGPVFDDPPDVDNADIGKAVGEFTGSGAVGKTYFDGDMDFDGDVDNADLGFVAGEFTGALAGNLTDNPGIADLIYDPATGNVKVDASEAAGGKVASFQLENAAGTFIPANYNGLTGGTFGTPVAEDGYEDVTAYVIGDSDLTFAGFTGIHDFGNVFPAGMDLIQLEAYLTTAVYTGAKGTGQQQFDLIPEPATLALLGLGGFGLLARRRRR